MKKKNKSIKLERARYVLVYYLHNSIIPIEDLRRQVNYQVNKLFGLEGSMKLGLYFSLSDNNLPIFVIRASHEFLYMFYTSLLFIDDYKSEFIKFIPIKTFGSIKGSKSFIESFDWQNFTTQLSFE